MSNENVNVNVGLINVDVPDAVDETAKALFVPPAQTVGRMMRDIIDMVCGPFHYFMEKKRAKWTHDLESYKQELQKEIGKIPPERISAPDLQITAQAVQDSVFCIESSELRKMFVKLLSASVDTDRNSDVHPSFSSIIKRITPDDAQVLMRFKEKESQPIVNYRLNLSHGHRTVESDVIDPTTAGKKADAVRRSLIVLQSLGLISITYEHYLISKDAYSAFDFHSLIVNKEAVLDQARRQDPDIKTIDYEKGIVELTSLGKQFLSVCA